jgi:hypothetical protein
VYIVRSLSHFNDICRAAKFYNLTTLLLFVYCNEAVKGESQRYYRWHGDDVVPVGLVVAAAIKSTREHGRNRKKKGSHVPNAKVPSSCKGERR